LEPLAASSVADIVEYIGQFDPAAARALRVRVDEAIMPLSNHPYLFGRGCHSRAASISVSYGFYDQAMAQIKATIKEQFMQQRSA
jgi:plasmid stabilization system protein ParE